MVLFSGLRVNFAMSSHSAANRKNFSDGSMGWLLPCWSPDQQNQNTFKRFPPNFEFECRAHPIYVQTLKSRPLRPTRNEPARFRTDQVQRSRQRPQSVLQLAIPLEDIAAAVPYPKAMGRQRCAAAEQIAPVHAAGAIAELGGGRLARGQILHIDGAGDRGR
jgi:hypothetical protein